MRGLMVMVAVGALARAAHAAPNALDKPAFTATPAELLAAAKAVPATGDVVLLREDSEISYDDRGRITSTWRLVFMVATKTGVTDWDTLQSTWLPAYQHKPTVRARVIDSNGRAFDIDQSLITDKPVDDASQSAPTDRRRLEAPLPRLSVGAIIEEQVTTIDREALPGGGAGYSVDIGGTVPMASVRVKYSSPKKLRTLTQGLPAGVKAKTETIGGRQVVSYAFGPLPALPEYEAFVTGEARPFPYVIATPVASWSVLAREYRALLDKQIAEGPLPLPSELPKAASLDSARAIVAWLHKQVQYTSVSFSNASVVPATPAEVLKRGYANSLEMATTLVALLRQTGMRADVALIDVGPGPDIDKDLPAINVFDHVVVRARIGKADVWIDPVERLTQLGVLPVYDQNRFVLPIAADTTGVVALPANPPATVREVRTFELAETGAAKVTEVSREGGVYEAEQRLWVRDSAADALKKNLTDYVKAEYKGELDSFKPSAVDDLTKPFEVTVVAKDAIRGFTHRENIDVFLFPTDALKKLPDVIGNPADDAKLRKYDFRNAAPHVYEIENRLVVPVGFTIPTPAAERTRTLGAYKLVERQRVEGQTFIVTFRLDASKARMTPAEVTALQQAMRELRNEPPLHLVIQHTGHALADKGKLKDAIAETTKLVKLHPKEAVHHLQLAHVLMKAGAGEAARRAARKAIEVEPKNADAHVVLGWMLEHDTFGNWLGFDHDRAAARTAFEKARKLDPKHVGAATELASLLERNPRGRRFDVGAEIRPAIEQWRAAHALDDEDEDITYSLATALLWVGDAGEAEKLLRAMPAAERRDQLLIVAIAITSGPEAGLRMASSLVTTANRTSYLNSAASTLFLMRRYDAMRAFYAELKYGQGNTPAELVLQKVKRDDRPAKPSKNPLDVVVDMAIMELQPGRNTNPYWDKTTRDEGHDQQRKLESALARNELMTSALLIDMLRTGMPLVLEGDAGLWRVELEQGAAKGQVYLAADRGVPKVVGLSDRPQGAGRHVLRLLAKNDEKNALRLLDWLAKDLRPRSFMDGVAQRFSQTWGAKVSRTRKDMELAAAVLSGTTDPARAIPILAQCQPATSDAQLACDWSLSDLYRETAKWSELEDHARTWATRAPKSLTIPTLAEAYGLAHLGRPDDGEAVIAEALAKDPDNHSLIFVHADMAIARGNLKEAIKRIEPLTTKTTASSSDCNNTSWIKLFEGSDLPGAATLGRKAVALAPNEPHAANTLAAVEAEIGELGEAKTHLDISVSADDGPTPSNADLYVHGRILEQLGFTDDAIATYRKIKDHPDTPFTPSSFDFTARRLKALGVKK